MGAVVTVFAAHPLNKAGVNIADAERFGQIEYVNQRYIYGDEITNNHQLPHAFVDAMCKAMKRFKPTEDYLLMAGDHVQIMTMCAILGIAHSSFSILRWDNGAQAYMPVLITPLTAG